MIKEIDRSQLAECLNVLHAAYEPIAVRFELTNENCPYRGRAELPLEVLTEEFSSGAKMYGYYIENSIVAFLSLSEGENRIKINDIVVLPEWWHKGIGTEMLGFAKCQATKLELPKVALGMIDDNKILRRWYEKNGFVNVGYKQFPNAPFLVGYMECDVQMPNERMKILYGTSNPAKLNEMRWRLKELPLEIIGLKDLDMPIPDIAEDGDTPLENAEKKAFGYYEAFGMPVFSCDSGLYFENDNFPPELQPGIHVRNVNGKRLSDAEMTAYYASLAERYGDLTARYRNGICFVLDGEHSFSLMDDSIASSPFLITSKPHGRSAEGFPLDRLSIDIATGKYYYDLDGGRPVDQDALDGFCNFFKRVLDL